MPKRVGRSGPRTVLHERTGVISVMRVNIDTLASEAVAELEISTPVTSGLNQAMLIRRIRGKMSGVTLPAGVVADEDSAGQRELRFALSTRQDQTAVPVWNDAGCIAHFSRLVSWMHIHDTAESSIAMHGEDGNFVIDFGDEGVIVADAKLSAYLQQVSTQFYGTAVTAAAQIRSCAFQIEYELVTLTDREFIGALSILENF